MLVELGVDAIGFIFHPESPRYVSPASVREICSKLPAFVNKAGVFVRQSPDEILHIIREAGLDTIQLHGDQDQAFVDKLRQHTALPIVLVRRLERLDGSHLDGLTERGVSNFLIDRFDPSEYGGTGRTLDLGQDFSDAQKLFIRQKLILSGGITIHNVSDILSMIRPYALDLSSSLESSKGVKDPDKIREFVKVFKSCK